MIEKFNLFRIDHNLFSLEDKILLAVSGGIDSMVMTHLSMRLGLDICIAHCNFGLRGDESDEDEVFVKEFAKRHNIPFFSSRFDTKSVASSDGLSIQMAARELRYKWFEEIRLSNQISVIALAHNLNDNIETFLINLIRGTGIAGLSGIKPRNGNLVRPLLFATRFEIKEYCDKYEVKFREDSSNSDTKYTRNKIRHLIVPVLRQINPSFENTIEETIGRVTDINEIYSEQIVRIRESVIKDQKNFQLVKITELLALTPLNTILFELFRSYGITKPMIPEFIKLTGSHSGSQLLTSTHRFIRNRDDIIINRLETVSETESVFSNIDDLVSGYANGKITFAPCDKNFAIPKKASVTCISLNKLKFPVTIRGWKAGDTFYPLGMNRKKKLSDFFIDSKFSIPQKEKALIMESAGKIACIIGVRTDNRFRITKATTKCLIIDGSAR